MLTLRGLGRRYQHLDAEITLLMAWAAVGKRLVRPPTGEEERGGHAVGAQGLQDRQHTSGVTASVEGERHPAAVAGRVHSVAASEEESPGPSW